jgi:hypothetical protein
MSSVNNFMMFGGIATALTAIGYVLNKIIKLIQSTTRFMDDWYGTEDYPGVVERLASGNARFDVIEREIALVKAELFNNHGTSLRDAIDRIEAAIINKK